MTAVHRYKATLKRKLHRYYQISKNRVKACKNG